MGREAGMVEKVIATLKTCADAVLWEQCLRVLVTLSNADGGCHVRLKHPSLGLTDLLASRKSYIALSVPAEDRPMHQEEVTHAATPSASAPGGGALVAVPNTGGSTSSGGIAVTD